MKKLITLVSIILLLNINTKAVEPSNPPTAGTVFINSWVCGMVGLAVYDFINTRNPYFSSNDGFIISTGLDPKMVYKEHSYNGIFRAGYEVNKSYVFLSSELFQAINYTSFGLGYDRLIIDRKMSLLTGLEGGYIYRGDNKYYPTGALNISSKYNLNKHLSLQLTGNFRVRPDISKSWIYSTYLLLNYKF